MAWYEMVFDIFKQVLIVTMPAFAGYVVWALQSQKKRKKADSKGIMLLLRQELEWQHDKWTAKGEIPRYALSNFDEIYECYHDLGGNGTATKMYEDIHALPLFNERVKEA